MNWVDHLTDTFAYLCWGFQETWSEKKFFLNIFATSEEVDTASKCLVIIVAKIGDTRAHEDSDLRYSDTVAIQFVHADRATPRTCCEPLLPRWRLSKPAPLKLQTFSSNFGNKL